MKKTYEGRTKEEAIREACEDLKVEKEDLIIEVLEDEIPKKTMFSILDRKKVKIEVEIKKIQQNKKPNKSVKKESLEKETVNIDLDKNVVLLDKVMKLFVQQFKGEGFEYKIEKNKGNIDVLLNVNNNNKWIGYRGKNLNAIQTILTAILSSNFQKHARVYVNIGKYKEERKQQLEILAEKIAKSVERTKKKVILEPMSSYERKIIHDYISKKENLRSESIGEEPNRKIVILLK